MRRACHRRPHRSVVPVPASSAVGSTMSSIIQRSSSSGSRSRIGANPSERYGPKRASLLWLFVDSADYLRFWRLQTLVICGHFRLSGLGFVTIKCPNDHQLNEITDDHLRAGSRGASRRQWRSPTTRRPGGSPRRNRRVRRPALPPGWRVVAPWGGRGDATPCPPHLLRHFFWWLAIPETCLPGEGTGC